MSMPHFVDTHKEMDKGATRFGATRKDDKLSQSDIAIFEAGYIERKQHMDKLNDLDLLASTILAIVYSGTEELIPGRQDAINQSTVACAIDLDGTLIVASNNISWLPKRTLPKYDKSHTDPEKFQTAHDAISKEKTDAWIAAKKKEFEQLQKPLPPKMGVPKTLLREIEEDTVKASLSHHYKPALAGDKKPVDPTALPARTILFDPKTELSAQIEDLSDGLVSKFTVLNENAGGDRHAEMQLLHYFLGRGYRPKFNLVGINKPCCRFCAFWLLSFGVQISTYHTVTPHNWLPPECTSKWGPKMPDFTPVWSGKMASSGAVNSYFEKLLEEVPPDEKKRVGELVASWLKFFQSGSDA